MPWQIDAESLIVCLNALREQFPAYVNSESERTAGDKAIFQVIEIVEDVMAGEFPRYGCALDVTQIIDCDGCKWKQKRHQKCSCCRRNRHLKDNFESVDGAYKYCPICGALMDGGAENAAAD